MNNRISHKVIRGSGTRKKKTIGKSFLASVEVGISYYFEV